MEFGARCGVQRVVSVLLFIMVVFSSYAGAGGHRDRGFQDASDRDPVKEQMEAQMQRDQEKKMNDERHNALCTDTEKLLKLATELKQYVDKSNSNTLSLDVVKKAEEIEKL